MLAWKRGIAILTAGQVKVTPDPRVRLVNGHTLQIRDAVPSDGGDYICQIATFEPREITHHVEILSKKIHIHSVYLHTCCFSTSTHYTLLWAFMWNPSPRPPSYLKNYLIYCINNHQLIKIIYTMHSIINS